MTVSNSTGESWQSARLNSILPLVLPREPVSNIELVSRSPTRWAAVWKVTSAERTFALRISNPSLSTADQWDLEQQIQRSATTSKLTPKLVASFPQLGASLTTFLRVSQDKVHIGQDGNLPAVAHLLRRMHAMQLPPIGERLLEPKIAWAMQRVAWLAAGSRVFSDFMKAAENFQELRRRLDVTKGEPCFVHGDLNPSNLLLANGHLFAVDFDHAHAGDPMFDLATICVGYRLDIDQSSNFLGEYFGRRATPAEMGRLVSYVRLAMLRYAFMTAAMVSNEKMIEPTVQANDMTPFGFSGQATGGARDNEILQLSRSFLAAAEAGVADGVPFG